MKVSTLQRPPTYQIGHHVLYVEAYIVLLAFCYRVIKRSTNSWDRAKAMVSQGNFESIHQLHTQLSMSKKKTGFSSWAVIMGVYITGVLS
jgi:hypothetical protein